MMISFVIPALNEEDLLGPCIDSIVDEIMRNGLECEIIVVDNGSTDSTAQVARRRGARVISEPRHGITFARQAGFKAATGNIIANIDADSIMPKGWMATVLKEFRDPGVVAVSGPLALNDVSRSVKALAFLFNIVTYVVYLINGKMIQGGNAAIRRKTLMQIGGYDTKIDFHGEDTDTAIKVARFGKIVWTWRLAMGSSGRRLTQEGVLRTGIRYAANYLSMVFVGRPVTKTHQDVRL